MTTLGLRTDPCRVSARTLASLHRRACALWLLVAAIETAIAVAERWPAQFGGKGDPAKIATQWISKGTALSPPLFMQVAMVVALLLVTFARRRSLAQSGSALAGLVGAIGIIGALGELLAMATPAVPRGVHDAAVIGASLSAAVAVTALAALRAPQRIVARPRREPAG